MGKALRFHKSSIQRLVATLEAEGFLEKSPDHPGSYRLGIEALLLGNVARASLSLRAVARPFLETLVERTQETAHLGVEDDFQVYYVEKIQSPQAICRVTHIGHRVPIHTSSMGKAMLAYMSPEEIDRGIAKHGLVMRTPNSISNRKKLDKELFKVRAEGVAYDNEEYAIGVKCIGAPVFDGSGKVIAAVSVSGPAQRLTPEVIPRFSLAVKEAAQNISRRLGYLPAEKETVPSRISTLKRNTTHGPR